MLKILASCCQTSENWCWNRIEFFESCYKKVSDKKNQKKGCLYASVAYMKVAFKRLIYHVDET